MESACSYLQWFPSQHALFLHSRCTPYVPQRYYPHPLDLLFSGFVPCKKQAIKNFVLPILNIFLLKLTRPPSCDIREQLLA